MPKNKRNSEHIKLSLRINTKVTSITLKKNIIALWLIYGTSIDIENTKMIDLNAEVTKFLNTCLSKWKKDHGKGLSAFITNKMIREFLDKDEYKMYKRLIKGL